FSLSVSASATHGPVASCFHFRFYLLSSFHLCDPATSLPVFLASVSSTLFKNSSPPSFFLSSSRSVFYCQPPVPLSLS
ncbi:hypothetical protein VIGAN_08216400, partial [Vigna angularis var. angularis]